MISFQIIYIYIYIYIYMCVCVCVCVEVNYGNKSDGKMKIEKQSIPNVINLFTMVKSTFKRFGRMVPSLPKIAKRTSNNNAIAYWSQQTYALFNTQARTATQVLDMPNALHNQTRSP